MHSHQVFTGSRILLPSGIQPASVHVENGVITRISSKGDLPDNADIIELGETTLLPGLVDSHVHINDPGRTQWEGFVTATKAAAAGGITTLVDMPLNSIPATTTLEGLEAKRNAAQGRCWVDVGFWGGLVPEHIDQLEPLLKGGVLGFKSFLSPSGVEEFTNVSEEDLRCGLPILAKHGAVLLVHAELPSALEETAATLPEWTPEERRKYKNYLSTRPSRAEVQAIELLIRLCEDYNTPIHVVHLATKDALPAIREAQAKGLPLTVETCSHYLYWDADQIPDGGTPFKCAPPIREKHHQDALWKALEDGELCLVASDHSPSPPDDKELGTGDFLAAWGGIASLQLGLPVVWTKASERGVSLEQVVQWMGAEPAKLAGLQGRKGSIEVGADADFVAFFPEETFEVEPEALLHRHPLTPYAGETLKGVVMATWLRGQSVYENGMFSSEACGRTLNRQS